MPKGTIQTLTKDKESLAKELVAVAYLEGDFDLSSGKKSKYFFDKYLFEAEPKLLGLVTEYLLEMIPPGTQRLAGMEIGAIPLITALSLKSGIPFVIVRKTKKSYGTARLVEGGLSQGDVVVLVEDVVTTGQQALRAVKVLQEGGAKVTKVICVIDREEGGRKNIEAEGLSFEALFTKTSLGI
ncbi:MAG: orotate phosphoribosyltransferase [Candidatus Brocadiaceae bacterium]|nr:orotate phosphoribosyltransferase [Candidatus Brocadiaceae bacterium]